MSYNLLVYMIGGSIAIELIICILTISIVVHNMKLLNRMVNYHKDFAECHIKLQATLEDAHNATIESMTVAANQILEATTRIRNRQNTLAQMINDDRARLGAHDEKVEELHVMGTQLIKLMSEHQASLLESTARKS